MKKKNSAKQDFIPVFKDKDLLTRALTHRSYLNEHKREKLSSNERLEFLGDAVLELWTTKKLFDHFPSLPEGVLTNIRAAVVCTESLAKTAKKTALGQKLLLSKGEEDGGGRKNPSLLANTFEAIIGAIYLDQGWEKSSKFLDKTLFKKLIRLGRSGDNKDAKTRLQEKTQAMSKVTPHYQILKEEGPGHAKKFTTAVFFEQEQISTGKGNSKREAEEKAAEKALTILAKKSKIGSDIKTVSPKSKLK